MGVEVVTCCYCGSRNGLTPGKPGVLTCCGCGAPVKRVEARIPSASRAPVGAETLHDKTTGKPTGKKPKPKARKKKKGLAHRLFDGLSDAIEDIFD